MAELSEAYVLGLLTDLEVDVPSLRLELEQAKKRAGAIDAELTSLVRRLHEAKAGLEAEEGRAAEAVAALGEHNLKISSLHQEVAGLKRRSEEMHTEMERVGPGAIQRKLRRDRAKLSVQMEDRESELKKLREEVEKLRAVSQQAEHNAEEERERSRAIVRELDKLQSKLPSPYLYARLFDRVAARAHCRLYLDHDPSAWESQLRVAITLIMELHGELRAGKYRLDKNSDIVGGRAMATAEGLYAAVALGDRELAGRLFALATDPALFFHQIFNVFRVWCLGLFLAGRLKELKELLRVHQYAAGLRGGYASTFIGLVLKDAAMVDRGLKTIVREEWEIWQDPKLVRGAGVVNVGAVALGRLALEQGIEVHLAGETTPRYLLAGPSPLRGR